ncbi:MAG: proton-conducting membrane transporter, partial [Oscillospiraceae bacterium]
MFKFKTSKARQLYIGIATVLNSIAVACVIIIHPTETFTMLQFTNTISLSFKIDGLGMVFAGLVAFLWPLATLYAFEYMKREKNHNMFFAFYIMTYGITLG